MIWLLLVWVLVGVIGGGLLHLKIYDINVGDAIMIVFVGVCLGPMFPIIVWLSIAPPKFLDKQLFRKYNPHKD